MEWRIWQHFVCRPRGVPWNAQVQSWEGPTINLKWRRINRKGSNYEGRWDGQRKKGRPKFFSEIFQTPLYNRPTVWYTMCVDTMEGDWWTSKWKQALQWATWSLRIELNDDAQWWACDKERLRLSGRVSLWGQWMNQRSRVRRFDDLTHVTWAITPWQNSHAPNF